MPFAVVAAVATATESAATATEAAASVVGVIAAAVRTFKGWPPAGRRVACPSKVLKNPWIQLEIPPWLQLQILQQQHKQVQ
jgi:hypothetical protein